VTLDWNLPLARPDFEKFVKGFNSSWMEDRWRLLTTPDEDNGSYTVEFRRSWTGDLYFILEVAADLDRPSGKGPAIKTIIWEGNCYGDYQLTEITAKDQVVHVSRAYMECEIEVYPKIDPDTLWEIAPLIEAFKARAE
jgi:hypothetical protein